MDRIHRACNCKVQNAAEEIRSPLRYPGGKSKALTKILPLIPLHFSEYREPFLGGGSVFVEVKQQNPNATFKINDFNHDLYCFWVTVKRRADELVDEATRIRSAHKNGRKLYEKLTRSRYASDEFNLAVRFYVLNRITYSGTIDSGGYSAEAFKKRFTLSNIEKIKPLSNLLQDVEITNKSYEDLLLESGKDVFIFMDPPYWKSRKSKLYGKNGDLHQSFDHRQFAENVKKCQHRWLITCDDSNRMLELFGFARIRHWRLQYGMNNVNKRRSRKGRELFITGCSDQIR